MHDVLGRVESLKLLVITRNEKKPLEVRYLRDTLFLEILFQYKM